MMEAEIYEKHQNFQAIGYPEEILEIRVYFDDNGKIKNVTSFHNFNFDGEQADFVVRGIIKLIIKKNNSKRLQLRSSTEFLRK